MYQRFAEGNKLDLRLVLDVLRDAIISRYGLKNKRETTVRCLSLAPSGVCNGISAQRAHHLNYTTVYPKPERRPASTGAPGRKGGKTVTTPKGERD